MMMNLFSTFDPFNMSLLIFNFYLNWTSTFLTIILIPLPYWILPSNNQLFIMIMFKWLNNEMKILIKYISYPNLMFLISLFWLILMTNILGLFPYIFTSTSHLVFNLSMTLPTWISFMIFGWLMNTKKMFIHLVPMGTPNTLMPFMVLIETISNIIRPWTLSIRLSANMIAGHLLLTLMGSSMENTFIPLISIMLIIQTMLMILELSVAMIQSYVFTILSTLYMSESN